jgi:ATP synthase F1 complex assembly factor 1
MTPERAPGRAPSLESSRTVATPSSNVRKDSSPVKVCEGIFSKVHDGLLIQILQPLSSILNMTRILSTPHTPAQISALWTAYHTARSNVCASIAVDMYERMVTVARKHASFVVPLARAAPEGGKSRSYEFFFMQWDFHGSPPPPSMACDDPFLRPAASDSDMVAPQTSTILFTPLQEFKLRASYATPYLVITHYTDLARSHGIVLLRGEITPGNGAEARYLVSQADAQLLALAVQRFYLWDSTSSGESQGEKLLKQFHERPKYFKWEELLNHADLV